MDAISAAANAATEYVAAVVVVADAAIVVLAITIRIRQTRSMAWDQCHHAMIWEPRPYPIIEHLSLLTGFLAC
jgi:hypothetical protein